MKRFSAFVAIISTAVGIAFVPATANARMQDHAHMHGQADATALSSGEVQKIDKATGKLTIQHGPLANLNMPGMTMVFKAADPAMLDQAKPGDQVRFRAEMVNGVFTVTKLELVR